MSFEDNDNFYVLKEDEKEKDESALNYASYVYQEEDDTTEKVDISDDMEGEDTRIKGKNVFGVLFRIMFNPVEGWKALRRSHINVEKIQSACFYPLLAVLAVCNFVEFFYSVNVSLTSVVTQAVVDFVSFFFAYLSIPIMLTWFFTKENIEKIEESYGKKFILISLSTLVLFSIMIKLLPILWPILIFLPIWTIYIMFKGVRFFRFSKNEEMKFYILSVVGVIGTPILIDWILNTVMPY